MPITIVLLPEESATAGAELEYLLSADGMQITSQSSAPLALLPAQAKDGVVVVLPAQAVSWSRLQLPQRVAATVLGYRSDPARVRAVLSGALEDVLLDEPQRLHFAVFADQRSAATEDSRSVWVAACNRDWLQSWLQALDTAAVGVRSLVAQSEPSDSDVASQVLWTGSADACRIVVSNADGVCVLPWGEAALALARAQTGAQVLAEPGVLAQAEAALGGSVTLLSVGQRLLQAASSRRNLAQFEFSGTRNARWLKSASAWWQNFARAPHWRAVRWGLGLLVVVQLFGLNALAWQANAQLAAQRASLRTLLLQTFPQVSVVVDPALQMQRELELLAQSRGASAGVDLVQVLSLVVPASSGEWTAIDLERGQLRLQGATLQGGELDILNTALSSRGQQARLQGDSLVVQAGGAR